MGMTAPDPRDLLSALEALADADEAEAPPGLRRRALDAALADRAPGASVEAPIPAPPLEAFLGQVDAVRAAVEGLTPVEWGRRVAPYDWTVQDVIGHLIGVESYLGGILGLWEFANVTIDDDHLALAEPTIVEYRTRAPEDAVAAWLQRARAIADDVAGGGDDRLAEEVTLYGYPFSVGSALVAHTFELWTHADDIRRAVGEPLQVPVPAVLRAVSDLSVRNLLLATLVTAPHQFTRSAKIVLTGPGGGVWHLGDADGGPDVVVVADVVDYCRMIARRIEPDELEAEISGDRALALDLFAAGRLLAA